MSSWTDQRCLSVKKVLPCTQRLSRSPWQICQDDSHLVCFTDRDDNYDIHLVCNGVDDLEEMDKLWNVIYQLKDEKVLNTAITIILSLYKNKNELEKLLIKCKELIKDEKTTKEIIDKCFKILRTIIIESEKYNIVKIKSHSNLNKSS